MEVALAQYHLISYLLVSPDTCGAPCACMDLAHTTELRYYKCTSLKPFNSRKCQRTLIDFTLTPDDFTRQWGTPRE